MMVILSPELRYVTTPELTDAFVRILTEVPLTTPVDPPDRAEDAVAAEAAAVSDFDVPVFAVVESEEACELFTSESLTVIFLSVLETRSERM